MSLAGETRDQTLDRQAVHGMTQHEKDEYDRLGLEDWNMRVAHVQAREALLERLHAEAEDRWANSPDNPANQDDPDFMWSRIVTD